MSVAEDGVVRGSINTSSMGPYSCSIQATSVVRLQCSPPTNTRCRTLVTAVAVVDAINNSEDVLRHGARCDDGNDRDESPTTSSGEFSEDVLRHGARCDDGNDRDESPTTSSGEFIIIERMATNSSTTTKNMLALVLV